MLNKILGWGGLNYANYIKFKKAKFVTKSF